MLYPAFMWVGSVDVPEELIRAHTDGRLVLFVGAGASVDPPSSLPLFGALAAQIAGEAGHTPSAEEVAQPDVLLGRLDGKTDVHHRVQSILNASGSAPNQLHEAIIALASSTGVLRIVTTNYDRHLTEVLAQRGIKVTEYHAPALPVGHDFEGLVYLHGALSQEPRRLVVTDRDFGRAYLTEAWATTFLQRMFQSYTALFIGYSHADVVMRYLARGLGPNAARFALADRTSDTNWEALGIVPVWFEVENGSWAQLSDTVQRWAERASMSLLDHRQRIAALVQSPPSAIPEDMSYLESLLGDVDTARLFTELASTAEWLTWANTRPEFGRLFNDEAPDDVTRTLAYWYAERFVLSSEELNSAALDVLAAHHGRLSAACASAIGHWLHNAHVEGVPRPAWLDRWLPFLLQAESWNDDWWELALRASQWPDNRHAALLLFDHLTEPNSAFDGFGSARPAIGRPRKGGLDGYYLTEVFDNVFRPNLGECAEQILAIADRHLRRAHQLHLLSANGAGRWDPISFRRAAIAMPSEHPERLDALIDAARDSLVYVVNNDVETGTGRCRAWAASNVPILERLAIHAITCATSLTSSAKVEWIAERPSWLSDSSVRVELAELIESSAATAGDEVLDAFVAVILETLGAEPYDDEEEAHANARWQLPILGAVSRGNPDHATTARAIEQLTQRYPDLAGWTSAPSTQRIRAGFVSDDPPMSIDEFARLVAADPTAAIAHVYEYREAHSPWNGPTWHGALKMVADVVAASAADGFVVLDCDQESRDLTGALIAGWSRSAIDEPTALAVIERLTELDLRRWTTEITQLLAEGGRSEPHPTKWGEYPTARALATGLWSALPSASAVEGVHEDWLFAAINSDPGRLAQFWLGAVSALWQAASDDWSGLPDDIRAAMQTIIEDPGDRGALGEVVLASNAHFLHAADSTWTAQHLLPHMTWADADRAGRNWQGYLTWGQPREPLLRAGLLDGYLDAASHAEVFDDHHRRQLAGHLAAIAIYSEVDLATWLPEFTRRAETAILVEWIQEVGWRLEQLDTDAVEAQWSRWMRTYWQERLNSVPTALTTEEATALAGWVLYLGGSYPEAVNLATQREVRFDQHQSFVHQISKQVKPSAPTGQLLLHVLKDMTAPFWGCDDLKAVFDRVAPELPADTVDAIRNQALRLGCANAHAW